MKSIAKEEKIVQLKINARVVLKRELTEEEAMMIGMAYEFGYQDGVADTKEGQGERMDV